MESITQSAVAGLIAALTATAILGLAGYVRQRLAQRRDARQIREILIDGRKRVMEAKDTYHPGMCMMMKADTLRAAQYNHMIREVGVALERWTVSLSHAQRKDVYVALDWYQKEGLYATEGDGEVVFVEIPEGKWPTTTMSREAAKGKFKNLESIKWLKLEKD